MGEFLAGELVGAPFGFHDAGREGSGRSGNFRPRTGRNYLRSSGLKERREFALGRLIGSGRLVGADIKAHGGEGDLLPLLQGFVGKQRPLRQVRGGLGDGGAERIDNLQQGEDIVDHLHVGEPLRNGIEANESSKRFHREDIELRARWIGELNQLTTAYLAGNGQAIASDSGLDGILPTCEIEADGLHFGILLHPSVLNVHARHCIAL